MADLSAIKLPNGDTYNFKDSSSVKKAGDTMTGTLNLASNKYYETNSTSGLDAKNSDLIGVNSIYFADASDGQSESINFYRDSTHFDSLYGYNGKMYFVPNRPKGGTGTAQEVYSIPNYGTGTTDISIRPYVAQARANRLAFLPADQVIIEQTTDGGTTWTSGGYTDDQKIALFCNNLGSIKIPLLNGAKSTNCGVRITITAMKYNVPSGTAETAKYNYWNSSYVLSQERYFNVREWWFWVSANSDTIRCKIENATGADSTNWKTVFNTDFGMTGGGGSDWIRAGSGATFGGSTTQTTNYWNWRLTFWSRMRDGDTAFRVTTQQTINTINCFGDSVWGSSNPLMKYDHLYLWDNSKNATFPANVTAPTFIGSLSGNASTATEFSANKSVALTGDITGSASSKAGWSVATTLANSGVTAGSYGPSSDSSPAAGGTISVPQVTVDAKGRVTSAASRTITLPAGGGGSSTVTLTGDVTGSGSTGGSITTTLANSGVTAGSYGLSANATPAAGSSFNVPYVTVDAKGRVTAASTKSVTLPTNASTVNGHTVGKDVPSNAVFTDTTALGSMTGTLGVNHGGTGQTTLTSGSYLIGNGTSGITSKTPSEVLSNIGAVSKSGDTMTGDLYVNSTGNTNSIHLHETNDNRGAIYVSGPSGCGDAVLYSNTSGSAELDIRNASQQNRVGMNISSSDDGTIFLRDSSNALATIQKADVDKWNSIIDTIYPVGSLYITLNNDDPSIRLGGSWIKLDTTGRFILSSSSSYPVSEVTVSTDEWGQTTYSITNKGGEATHTLTVDEMPSHNHTVPRGGNAFGTKTHGYTSTSTLFTSTDDRMSHTGGGQAHNNMPPYFTAHIWYRYA